MAEDLPAPFGKYFLTEKLATGGMAEIYLAKLIGPGGFEKPLVIKQIHPRLTGQRHFVDLFVAEAKTLVTLAHGNIVPVYELGVVDDTYYIAMDYIDGPTLYRLTEALARRETVMHPAVAAWITARVLDGLDYAHRKGDGVIHRDLSPRNVMLSRDGEVKLVDFGIAVTLGDAGEGDHSSAPTGSFPYMSPEQVRKEPLSGQTDLFSVGVLAWEMLTGQRLFARESPDATLAAVSGADIPLPSSVRPDIPAKLDEVVMRALDRDVASRWATAGDMLAAINKYLYGLDETPGPRDVSSLVARFCPPETRRLPTHAEALVLAQADEVAVPDAPIPDTPAGPRTAVIPRDGAAKGKPRAPTRQQSFATHVELKDMFERATPMFGVAAISDDSTHVTPPPPEAAERTDHTPIVPTRDPDEATANGERADAAGDAERPGRHRTARSQRSDDTSDVDRDDAHPAARSGRMQRIDDTRDDDRDGGRRLDGRPPAQGTLALIAVGALILGGLALYVFVRGRAVVMVDDAAPKLDVPSYAIFSEASVEDRDAGIDAPTDAGHADATADAHAIDSGARPVDARPDAVATPADHLDGGVTGTATLSISATPWGNVSIDNVARGQAPNKFTVSAGHHVVVVEFTGEDVPKSRTFQVDLLPGEIKPLEADFTKP